MKATFCGHSEVSHWNEVKKWLIETVEGLIIQNVDTFLLGGYGDFDKLAAVVVWELKKKYPQIKSFLVLPYLNGKFDKSRYDGAIYTNLEKVPKPYAIIHRNRYMVDESDIVVAYVQRSWGGAAKTLEYAEKKNKRIIFYR